MCLPVTGYLVYQAKPQPDVGDVLWGGKVPYGVDIFWQRRDFFAGDPEARELYVLFAELEFIRIQHDSALRHCLQELYCTPPMVLDFPVPEDSVVDATLFVNKVCQNRVKLPVVAITRTREPLGGFRR